MTCRPTMFWARSERVSKTELRADFLSMLGLGGLW